jgi:hypothetical protein
MYEVVLEDADLAMELFYAIGEGEINFHEVAINIFRTRSYAARGDISGTPLPH